MLSISVKIAPFMHKKICTQVHKNESDCCRFLTEWLRLQLHLHCSKQYGSNLNYYELLYLSAVNFNP